VEDRPVRARRTGELERGWRWCRRNPAVAVLGLALLLALVGGLAGVSWKWQEAQVHLAEADSQRHEADRQRQIAREEAERTRYLLYVTNMQLAAQLWDSEEGTALAVADLLRAHIPRPGEKDLRDFAWRYQWGLLCRCMIPLPRDAGAAWQGVFTPDGQLLLLDAGRRLRFWDPASRRTSRVLDLPAPAVRHLALAPDGRTVAAAATDGTVRLLDVTSGHEHHVLRVTSQEAVTVAFLPDGQTLLTHGTDGACQT
jgi:WD40 repeat protein